jgi:diguanylate cyclase (GGDEF)-like protein/PAS domain S-box-containing protein
MAGLDLSLHWTWLGLAVLLLLGGAAALVLRSCRQRVRQTWRLQYLSQFHAMRAEIGQLLLDCSAERTTLQALCTMAVSSGRLRMAHLSMPDASGVWSLSGAAYADSENTALQALACRRDGLAHDAWQATHLLCIPDLRQLRRLRPWQSQARALGIGACIALPISKDGRPWAILCCYLDALHIPGSEFIPFLEQLALEISAGLARHDAQRLESALLEHSRAGIVMVKGRMVQHCNAICARMLGYEPGELANVPTRILYHGEEEYARVGAAYARMLANGKARLDGVRYACKDGTVLVCDVTGVLLADASEEWSVWTLEDITLRDRQSRRLERLAKFNALLAETNRVRGLVEDKAELYREVCRAAIERAGLRLAWIGVPDPQSGIFRVLAAAGATAYLDQVTISSREGVAGGMGPTGVAWREDRPVFARRYRLDTLASPWKEQAERYGFGAFAALPIHEQERVGAVLTVYCGQEDVFDDDISSLLEALAFSIDSGLQDIWQRGRITRLQHLYRALMGEGDVVLQARSSHEMLLRTCEKLVEGTPFHAAWVARPGGEGSIEQLASAGEGAAQLAALDLLGAGNGQVPLVQRCWEAQRTIFNNDHRNDPQLSTWLAFLQRHQWCAALASPVLRGGEIWAVLVFVSPQTDVFDAQTVELCEFVCALLGHGLDEMDLKQRLLQLQQEDAHRARHDGLTGLPNRYAVEQHLGRAIALAARTDGVVAVGMIDLDDFKPVNDNWGHEAGDRLLQMLAGRLQAALRTTDMLARLGGDEFVLVIEGLEPQAVTEQLQQVFSRLHLAVETPFALGPGEVAEVQMSMGVALFPQDGQTPEALIRQADVAMYQAKTHKHDRHQWWCGETSSFETKAEPAFAPYDDNAVALLGKFAAPLARICDMFSTLFTQDGWADPLVDRVWAALDPAARERILQLKVEHMHFLLAPQTRHEQVLARAAELGRLHALVGVPGSLLTQLRAKFRAILASHLNRVLLSARDRYRLLLVADARLQDDLQSELDAGQAVTDAYLAFLARPLPQDSFSGLDAYRDEMRVLAALPGMLGCALLRPNAQGVFQVEVSAGEVAESVRDVFSTPGLQPVFDKREAAGQGIIPLAWRSGVPEFSPVYARDPRMHAWHGLLDRVPVQSMAAVPIKDHSDGVTHVLAVFACHPNQFASHFMRQFAFSLQQRLTGIRHAQPQAPAIAETMARQYREQLFAGGFELFMQPIVDLKSGDLLKAEALARLRMPGGLLVAPDVFLPLLGNAEYDRLFRLGLDQALAWLHQWDEEGVHIGVSVNLPPCTLQDPACPGWVEEALLRHRIDPGRLTLELLEHQHGDPVAQNRAILELNRLGVHLAMDDLGSGYSSLQRLSALLFSSIKSDQALLARSHENPVQALSLLGAIIQMGRDFECDVVIEGLEDVGMVEAATILGARQGQGYALGRPMPARLIPSWLRTFRLPVGQQLATPLGALAYLWLAMHSDGCMLACEAEACPIGHYLQRCGETDGVAWRLHAQIHAGVERQQASNQLMRWFCEHIRQARRKVVADTARD